MTPAVAACEMIAAASYHACVYRFLDDTILKSPHTIGTTKPTTHQTPDEKSATLYIDGATNDKPGEVPFGLLLRIPDGTEAAASERL